MQDAIDELVARSQDHKALRAFHEFHKRHPEVLDFLVDEIQLLVQRGRKAFSFGSLYEYARWKLDVHAAPGEAFAMNDHASPYYGRAIVILHPEFNGMAEFRFSTADEVFGTRTETLDASGPGRRRRLQWSDGDSLEAGWRPRYPHVLGKLAKRKPDIHGR